MSALRDLLASARQRQGMSQADLAAAIGTTRQYVQGIEQGHKTLSHPYTIARIAEALELDSDEIYTALGRVPPDIEDNLTMWAAEIPGYYDSVRRDLAIEKE